MCIRIVNAGNEIQYDSQRPLEEQIAGGEEVIIRYEPKDPMMDKFMEDMERLCRTGVSCDMNINVIHNNNLKGAKAKKQIKRLMKDIELNEAIKLLSNLQQKTDNSLLEISEFCLKIR